MASSKISSAKLPCVPILSRILAPTIQQSCRAQQLLPAYKRRDSRRRCSHSALSSHHRTSRECLNHRRRLTSSPPFIVHGHLKQRILRVFVPSGPGINHIQPRPRTENPDPSASRRQSAYPARNSCILSHTSWRCVPTLTAPLQS